MVGTPRGRSSTCEQSVPLLPPETTFPQCQFQDHFPSKPEPVRTSGSTNRHIYSAAMTPPPPEGH